MAAVTMALAGTALLGLLYNDYRHIGDQPLPCAAQPNWHADIALVLTGAPRLRRTRPAVSALHAGHVDRVAITGAGNGGDSAILVARQAQQTIGLTPADTVIEDRARSTYQNFQFSCRLPGLADAQSIAISTDRRHLWRAYATARRQCPGRQLCTIAADQPVTEQNRRDEALRLWAYQLLGRAALFP